MSELDECFQCGHASNQHNIASSPSSNEGSVRVAGKIAMRNQ